MSCRLGAACSSTSSSIAPPRSWRRRSFSSSESEHRAPSMGANYRVSAEQLSGVPAVNRNFTDLSALSPATGVQSSLLGQRWTSTDIRVDGAQARNMLRAGEFGAGPFTLSMEAIREFEVTSAVYDVTQGRQGGGSIRAATKAGTNTWTGSAFTYYRGSDLTAENDFQSRSRSQRQFSALQWGGSVGGPIVRDRLHMFVALDRWDSNEPLFTGLIQTPTDELSTGVAKDSLARLIGILSRTYALDTSARAGWSPRSQACREYRVRADRLEPERSPSAYADERLQRMGQSAQWRRRSTDHAVRRTIELQDDRESLACLAPFDVRVRRAE